MIWGIFMSATVKTAVHLGQDCQENLRTNKNTNFEKVKQLFDTSQKLILDPRAHHEPQVCAVGDHLLLESKKDKVGAPPQPTQHELIVKDSQEAGFSQTIAGQDPQSNPHGRWTVPDYKELDKPRSTGGSKLLRNFFGRTQICPVLDAFGSEDQGLLPGHNTAWIRISSGR